MRGIDDDVPDRCPDCGRPTVLRIQYGEPLRPPGPGVVLGGCHVEGPLARWQCGHCGHRWGAVHPASPAGWDQGAAR